MKRLKESERDMYAEFTAKFPFCFACFWNRFSERRSWMLNELNRAHLVGGAGRVADVRAIVMLCAGCHRLSHGDQIRFPPGHFPPQWLPNLRLEHLLWLKNKLDPENYDRNFLCQLKMVRAIPTVRETPAWFNQQRQLNRSRVLSLVGDEQLRQRIIGILT